jgi:hypothetical protein
VRGEFDHRDCSLEGERVRSCGAGARVCHLTGAANGVTKNLSRSLSDSLAERQQEDLRRNSKVRDQCTFTNPGLPEHDAAL